MSDIDLELQVKSVGEYLGCNEAELWSEMQPIIQEQVRLAQLNTLMQLKIDYMNHTLSTYPTEWTPIINFIENQIKELKGDK